MNWEGFISWEEPILKNSWIIWSTLLYFNFKTFKDPNFLSFISFQCVLYDSQEFLSDFWNFYKLKRGRPNFCGEPILQKVWIIWCPLLHFNLKNFIDPNSSSFIRFQCILHDSRVLFSELSNFYKLKKEAVISWGTNFAESLNYLVPPSVFQF